MSIEDVSNALLQEFGAAIGMPELEFNEQDLCLLSFDESLLVAIHRNLKQERWTLQGFLGEFPPDMPGEFYRRLLVYNYDLIDLGAPRIGLEEESGSIMLLQSLLLGQTTAQSLQDDLAGFLEIMESLIEHLNQELGLDPEVDEEPAEPQLSDPQTRA